MIVNGGQPTSITYSAFDQVTTLKVAFLVYDVTSGTAIQVGTATAMVHQTNGVYVGSFTPLANHYYLVIAAAFLDSQFTTPDPQRAPSAQNYDCPSTDTTKLNFNYATYDQQSSLSFTASITNLTNQVTSTQSMTYVALGVYFGQYTGAIGKTYAVIKYTADPYRAPGADTFQCYALSNSVVNVVNYLSQATLVGPAVTGVFQGHS